MLKSWVHAGTLDVWLNVGRSSSRGQLLRVEPVLQSSSINYFGVGWCRRCKDVGNGSVAFWIPKKESDVKRRRKSRRWLIFWSVIGRLIRMKSQNRNWSSQGSLLIDLVSFWLNWIVGTIDEDAVNDQDLNWRCGVKTFTIKGFRQTEGIEPLWL